ncbi:MAG: Ca2+-binding EF-hand superfamily protein [Paraglaciecola sp.]|jgi:Ca2+-binding EF-hand superfamily protein
MKKSDYFGPFIFVAAAVQLMFSVSTKAQEDIIQKLDQDLDGKITIKEAVADPTILASFGRIDVNGDGKISKQELENMELAKKRALRKL